MPGYKQSPVSIIQQLRDNLHNRYRSEFCILKELIQNANDAGARRMAVGWASSFPAEGHPLFEVPAVFVVNDGPVRETDIAAVSHFGLSNKAADTGSVGKFGLGMKSVFHVCEAFFFFCHREGSIEGDLLNPWSPPAEWRGESNGLHEDWESRWQRSSEEATRAFGRWLEELAPNWEEWFALWLPLRTRRCCGGIEPILAKYPGEGQLPPSEMIHSRLAQDIASMLPLLDNLEEVRVFDAANEEPTVVTRIGLVAGSKRRTWHSGKQGPLARRFTESLHRVKKSSTGKTFAGRISLEDSENRTLAYFGRELCSQDAAFAGLKRCEFWPKTGGIDEKTGGEQQVPDKGEPHGAVCLMRYPASPGEQGVLTVGHAVFLPLSGENMREKVEIDGPECFTLYLHGFYFIDAGRQGIQFAADGPAEGQRAILDEGGLRRRWNRLLLTNVVLPLVIPTLESFVQQEKLDDEGVSRLTAALVKSRTIGSCINEVCVSLSWARIYRSGRWQWSSVDSGAAFRRLPSLSERDTGLMPVLDAALEGSSAVLLSTESPRLMPEHTTVDWTTKELVDALRGLDKSERQYASRLRVAEALLRDCRPKESATGADLNSELRRFLASMIIVRLPQGEAEKWCFAKLVGMLPPCNVHIVGCEHPGRSLLLWQRVNQATTHALVLPEALVSQGHVRRESHFDASAYDQEDAVAALHTVRKLLDTDSDGAHPSDLQAVVLEILSSSKGLDLCETETWPLVRAEPADGKRRLCSVSELCEAKSAGRLFRQGGEGITLLPCLRSAIATDIYVVSQEVAKAIFPVDEIPYADAAACLDLLVRGHELSGAPKERASLLRLLLDRLPDDRSEKAPQALRYLVHASRKDRESDAALLRVPDRNSGSVWEKLAKMVLKETGEEWRVVPPEVAEVLRPPDRRLLAVDDLTDLNVLLLIAEAGPNSLDYSFLADSDCDRLLADINPESPLNSNLDARDVLLEMPLFRAVSGRRCIPDEDTYLDTDASKPPEVVARATIVRRPSDSDQLRTLRALLPEWGAKALAQQGLRHPTPWIDAIWPVIAENCANVDLTTTPALKKELREIAWLPVENRGGIAPKNVVDIPTLERDLDTSDAGFVFSGDLSQALREHQAFRTVQEMFADRQSAVQLLGDCLAEDEDFCVGQMGKITNTDDFRQFVGDVRELGSELMPVGRILKHVAQLGEEEERLCRDELLPRLAKPIPPPRLSRLVNEFADRRTKHASATSCRWNDYFREALSELAHAPAFATDWLPQLRLPNRLGELRQPNQLCLNAFGVAPSHLLDEQVAELLAERVVSSAGRREADGGSGPEQVDEPPARRGTALQREVDQTPIRLRRYFEPWLNAVPHEVIGLFAALLGDEDAILEWAKEMLGTRHTESVRNSIDWCESEQWGNIHQAMARQATAVRVVESDETDEMSLTGGSIRVPLAQAGEMTNLLVGDKHHSCPVLFSPGLPSGRRAAWLQLRSISPAELDEKQFLKLLAETIRAWLEHVFMQHSDGVDSVLEDLMQSEQVEVDVVRNLLLEHAFFYLSQLRAVSSNADLKELVNHYQDACYQREEERANKNDVGVKAADDRLAQRRDQLGDVLANDATAQQAVLQAVRGKVADEYQYKVQSVLFELLQNADDALVEWYDSSRRVQDTSGVAVSLRDGVLRFAHRGRPVNHYRFPELDGRKKGFHRDLEKMLVMSSSTKSGDTESDLTGKFGLGFKTVFLLSDCPVVASGRLCFRIAAAFLPTAIAREEVQRLRTEARELCDRTGSAAKEDAPPTLFKVPLREGSGSIEVEVLQRFRDLLGLQVALARRVRRCFLESPDGTAVIAKWEPVSLPGIGEVEAGSISDTGGRLDMPRHALVFRLSKGAVLFALGRDGFEPLPEDVPTLWVTVPTTSSLRLGLVINGPFELDIGRSNLAEGRSENEALAVEMGRELGTLMLRFYDALRQESAWQQMGTAMGLDCDRISADAFWASLWELILQEGGQWRRLRFESQHWSLLRKVLFHTGEETTGLLRLAVSRRSVPSLLPAPYDGNVGLADLQWIAVGAIDADHDVFSAAMSVEGIGNFVEPGTLISEGRVESPLKELATSDSLRKCHPLDIKTLLLRAIGQDPKVKPDCVDRIRWFVDWYAQASKRLRGNDAEEIADLREALGALYFLAEDATWQTGADLLCAKSELVDEEEELLSRFAPASNLLSSRYTPLGQRLMLFARGDYAPAEGRIASWLLEAPPHDERRRDAALRYLANGRRSVEVARIAKQRCPESWVEDVRRSPDFARLDPNDRSIVLGRLDQASQEEECTFSVEQDGRQVREPGNALERLYNWWGRNRSELVREYERRLYDGHPPKVTLEDDFDEIESRRNWLTLLMHGAFHTMGRVTWEANRGFVGKCNSNGWLDVFAAKDARADDWIGVLDQFLDDEQNPDGTFYHWMRQYVVVYQLSRQFSTYVQLFSDLNRRTKEFSLDEFLRPLADPVYRGTGIEAVQLHRPFGMGVCYVLRELCRWKLISNPVVYGHCFMPAKRVRELLSLLGLDVQDDPSGSRRIWEWLESKLGAERATFQNDFDLPLQLLTLAKYSQDRQNILFKS